MKGAVLRNMSVLASRFLLSSSTKSNTFSFNSLPNQPSLNSLTALTRFPLRFYSSHSQSTKDDDDDGDVSSEELKKRIQKFFDGDEEAVPSIFEGILKRKLSGKHEESDDELMKQIDSNWNQPRPQHYAEDQEFDSDQESDSDQELDSDLSESSDTDSE